MHHEKSNDCFCLPVCETPMIRNDHEALQCSVLQSLGCDITPVLINNYTNIVKKNDLGLSYNHLHTDAWFKNDKITQRQYMNFYSCMFTSRRNELIDLITDFISNGYYLSGHFNSFYISAKHAYGAYDTKTVYLIYGYNKTDNLFYAIGKTRCKHFGKYEIPFKEYLNGILNKTDLKFNLSFVKFNEELDAIVSYSKIYNGIYDYLHSKNKEDSLFPKGAALNYKYGLDCYRDFLNMISTLHEHRYFIEPLSYDTLWEHHIIMRKRIEYLKESGALTDLSIVVEYDDICKKAEEVYNYCVEYNTECDPDKIKIIYLFCGQIIDDEAKILNKLLLQIKKHLKDGA